MSDEEEGGASSEAEAFDSSDGAMQVPLMSESFLRVISLALQLPRQGAALLEWMAEFDVWSGDLRAMRGDEPAVVAPAPFTARKSRSEASILDVLAARKAFLSLDESCRTFVRALVIDGSSHAGDEIARRRLHSCLDRLQLGMNAARRELAIADSGSVSDTAAAHAIEELLHG